MNQGWGTACCNAQCAENVVQSPTPHEHFVAVHLARELEVQCYPHLYSNFKTNFSYNYTYIWDCHKGINTY